MQKQHLRLAFESGQGRGRSFNIKPYDIKTTTERGYTNFLLKSAPFQVVLCRY